MLKLNGKDFRSETMKVYYPLASYNVCCGLASYNVCCGLTHIMKTEVPADSVVEHVSQRHEMNIHDLDVMGANPGPFALGGCNPSV